MNPFCNGDGNSLAGNNVNGPTPEQAAKERKDREKQSRGFAGMDPAKQREIASQGGRAAHRSGNAHRFTSDEARAAGKKRHAKNGSAGD
jgi:hypothetical protein